MVTYSACFVFCRLLGLDLLPLTSVAGCCLACIYFSRRLPICFGCFSVWRLRFGVCALGRLSVALGCVSGFGFWRLLCGFAVLRRLWLFGWPVGMSVGRWVG